MKIESIDIYHVCMPLIKPWRTAYGSDDSIESILVRMCAQGAHGWGESSPLAMPFYSPEYAAGVFSMIKDCLAPSLIGKAITSGSELQSALAHFKGNPFAKAALDTAWWDLHASALGQPLYRVLGGSNPHVFCGADFGIGESVEKLVEDVGVALSSGAPRIKLKYAPGWDLPVIEKIRETFPEAIFHIDCNAAYSLSDLPMFLELDRFQLAMFEQPLAFNDLVDHSEMRAQVETPICLDESINSLHALEQAIKLQACQWVNIKPGRVGGLTVALQIHDLCQANKIPCWVGGMLESAVGAMHCAALATLPNIQYANDIFPSGKFYAEDLSEPPIAFSSPWTCLLGSAPGLGARPRSELLDRWTVNQISLSSR